MSKGLAVTQIALLIIAMIVIAVIGYFVYSTYVGSNKSFGGSSCNGQIMSACTSCKVCFTSNGQLWSGTSIYSGCSSICVSPSGCTATINPSNCINLGVT